ACIDAEHHRQRWRLDILSHQRLRIQRVADAVADVDRFQADDRNDIAGGGLVGVLAAETVEYLKLLDLALHDALVTLDDGNLLAGLDLAVVDAADADSA